MFSSFLPKIAFANDLIFSLNTNGYESGTWTNQDVTVTIEYSGDTSGIIFEYSISGEINFTEFDGTQSFSEEGSYYVYFRIRDGVLTSNNQSVFVRIDKTAPVISGVVQSEYELTNQNIELIILATDIIADIENSIPVSGVYEYKIKNSNWQNSHIFIILKNIDFEIGDILVRDRAGNVSFYNETYQITNVFKNPPEFTIEAETSSAARNQLIMLENVVVESGIESVKVTLPNGEIVDITNTYEEGFLIEENGTYIFTIKSNAGLEKSLSLRIKNIRHPIQDIFSLFATAIFISSSIILGINAVNLTKKRLIKKTKWFHFVFFIIL